MQLSRFLWGVVVVCGYLGNYGGVGTSPLKFESEEEATETPISSQASLVYSPAGPYPALCGQDQTPLSATLHPSFQRSRTSTTTKSSNGTNTKSSSVEVQGLQKVGQVNGRILFSLWQLLVLLLGQDLCASEWPAEQLSWRLWGGGDLEMALDIKKAVYIKPKEKKELIPITQKSATSSRQWWQRWTERQTIQADRIGKGQRQGWQRWQGSAFQDLGASFPTTSCQPFCSLYAEYLINGVTINRSTADDSGAQECLSRPQPDSRPIAAVDGQSGSIRGQRSYQKPAQGDQAFRTSAKAAPGVEIGSANLRQSLEGTCRLSFGSSQRTERRVSEAQNPSGRDGKESGYRTEWGKKDNRETQQDRRKGDLGRRGRFERGNRGSGNGRRCSRRFIDERLPRAVCSLGWTHSVNPECGETRDRGERSQKAERRSSFSRGQRATSGSPAKVTLSQTACWYIFCEHDLPLTIEIPHAREVACEPRSDYNHHLYRHSICMSDDYVSPSTAICNAELLAKEVQEELMEEYSMDRTSWPDGFDWNCSTMPRDLLWHPSGLKEDNSDLGTPYSPIPLCQQAAAALQGGNSDSGAPVSPCGIIGEDNSDLGTHLVPHVSLRPNQNIVPDFDDFVPYVYRDSRGNAIHGTIIPPPQWQEHPVYRAALHAGVAYREATGRLVVTFRSWLIKHNEAPILEHRDFSMRPQLLVQLAEHARRVWRDHIPTYAMGHSMVSVHLVRPTPMNDPADPPGTRLLHLLIEFRRPRITNLMPMLIATRQISASEVSNPFWLPTLVPHPFGTNDILQITALPCALHQLLVPLAGRVRRWMNPYHQRDAVAGLFLPVWYDLRLQPLQPPPYEEEPSANSLLQLKKWITSSVKNFDDDQRAGPPDSIHCRLQDEPPTMRLSDDSSPGRDEQLLLVPDDIATSTFLLNQDVLVANGVNVELPLEVDTYGLYVQHFGHRRVRLPDLSVRSILDEIRRAWDDVPHAFTAILARPPSDEPTKVHFIVEFLDFHRMPIPGTTPTLRRVFDIEAGDPIIKAAYHVGGVNPYLLIGQVPLRHRCEPWGQLRCAVRRNGEILIPLSRPALDEGDFLDFFVYPPDPMDPEVDEGVSLMQRSVSRSPRRPLVEPGGSTGSDSAQPNIVAHTYQISRQYRLVTLNQLVPMSYVTQLENIFRFPAHTSLLAMHEVRHPPHDLESSAELTLILETTTSRTRQAVADDQLVMVDLIIHDKGSSTDATHIRRIVWARHFMSRDAVLHLLSAQVFCASHVVDCALTLNHVPWSQHDTTIHELAHGDFIQLKVDGPPTMAASDIQMIFCEQESADIQRFLFHQSPAPSPRSPTSQAENSDSEEPFQDDSPVEPLDALHMSCKNSQKGCMNPDPPSQLSQPYSPPQFEGGNGSWRIYEDDSNHLVDSLTEETFVDVDRQPLGNWTNRDLAKRTKDHFGHTTKELDNDRFSHKLEVEDTPLAPPRSCPHFGLKPHVADRWCASQSGEDNPFEVSRSAVSPLKLVLEELVPPSNSCPTDNVPCSTVCQVPGLQNLIDAILQKKPELDAVIPNLELLDDDIRERIPKTCTREVVDVAPPSALFVYTDGSKLWNVSRAEEVAAWAFVVVACWDNGDEEIFGFQAATVQPNDNHPAWAGASLADSYQAEVEAIIRALLWLCQEPLVHGGVPATIVADSTSALFATDGTFNLFHPLLKTLVRPLHKFVSQITAVGLQWQKSHVGNVYNELADHLAKHFARAEMPVYLTSPIGPKDALALSWMWMTYPQDDGGYPSCKDDAITFPIPAPLAGRDVPVLPQLGHFQSTSVHLSLRLASHNVNSFKDSNEKHELTWTGRAELLRQQVLHQGFNVIAWQETRRSFEGRWSSQQLLGYEAKAEQGQGGMALWFRKDKPFATLIQSDGSKSPMYFQEAGFVIHVATAHLMIVEYHDVGWKGIFVAAHAPTEMQTMDHKQSFWNLLSHRLQAFQSCDIFLMIDANSRIGSEHDDHVGVFGADDTNDNGFLFHAFLKQNAMWVPSTFEEHVWDKTDQQGTWLSKGGWKRIDFIATNLPRSISASTWTTTLEKDVLHDDHCVVCIDLEVQRFPSGGAKTNYHTTLRLDREAMTTDIGKQRCVQILQSLNATKPSWTAAADEHALHFTTGAQVALEQAFPFHKAKPKPSWIDSDTWDTLKTTRWAKRQLRSLRDSWNKGMLSLIFQFWKSRRREEFSYRPWLRQHDRATAYAMDTSGKARQARITLLRRDEARMLELKAQQNHDALHEAKGTLLWKQLKMSLPKFRQKNKKPLPMASAHLSFEKHFAAIEDAKSVQMKELTIASNERSRKALQVAVAAQMPISQLPTIFELEDAIRSLSSHKAFIGCVPAELLKASPAVAAEMLFPAMIMFFRYLQQPTSWKGGQYFPLYKGKGSPADACSFRAILIGNTIPKIFHKIVRQRLVRTVQPHLLPFQIGGVPKMSVHFAAHFLQCLRRQAHLQRKSHAVIFVDIRSAFYRSQRSTVVADQLGYGDDAEDEDVAVSTLAEESALTSTGVPSELQRVIQELFSQTWNTVTASGPSSNAILQSVRGTRPGDPVADLTFTCVMKQVLERFMQVAGPSLPCIHTPSGDTTIPAITWVDDVAIYIEAEQADNLIPLAQFVVRTLHQQCRAVGLDLNYSQGKTEVLFRFNGKNSDKIRRQLHQRGSVDLGKEDWSQVKLPVATKYTHLGIKHAANMSFDVELNYRLARAREALAECRKPVLKNEAMAPSTRWTLSRSLILSRLFFGAELWPELTQQQYQRIQQFLIKVARIILRCENFAETAHTTDDFVCSQLPIPDVTSLLRTARLRYASRMYQYAPALLIHLVEQMQDLEEFSWINRLQSDIKWMQERTPGLRHMVSPSLDFETWKSRMWHTKDWTSMANRALEADTTFWYNKARYQIWRLNFSDRHEAHWLLPSRTST